MYLQDLSLEPVPTNSNFLREIKSATIPSDLKYNTYSFCVVLCTTQDAHEVNRAKLIRRQELKIAVNRKLYYLLTD